MLNPSENRLDYGQILAPPIGYKLDFAIGTTYSLDLDALVGATIPLGLSEDTDSELMQNPICLLNALRATGDKVALFCEAGQIHLPSKVTQLYILLEKIVFQVSLPKKHMKRHPSFHPKFWLLKYTNEHANILYKVVVLSRNLTFDRSWDVAFCMSGSIHKRKTLKTTPIIDFLSYFIKILPTDNNGKNKSKKIKTILQELPYVHFQLDSKEFDDFEFLPLGVKKGSGKLYSTEDDNFFPLFGDKFHEILVMSPFLSSNIINEFNNRNEHANVQGMLFTRKVELEKLNPPDCEKFKIFTMKDAIIDGESIISGEEGKRQQQDIHAKIFLVRKYTDSYLYFGSMNATLNAIKNNVEFMIMLKGKNRYLNMTKLSENFFGGLEDNDANPFEITSLPSLTANDSQDSLPPSMDDCIKEICREKTSAIVTSNGNNYDLHVKFNKIAKNDYTINISPLLSKKTKIINETVIFSQLVSTELSKFYKIEVSDQSKTIQRVIIIPTEGMPEDREQTFISSIIQDKNSFYRYINFLLGDDYLSSALEIMNYNESIDTYAPHSNLQFPTLYEKMLHTAAKEPQRLKEIDYLINNLSSDNVIPEGFIELYTTFKKAVNSK